MRIITWNINSVRVRIDLIKKLNDEYNPDILCLQETKSEDIYFPEQEIKNIGFKYMVFTGEKSYNGVAILSKWPIKNPFSIDLYNRDKRHICGEIHNLEIHNFYVPAGGSEPDIHINPKFRHKLEYIQGIQKWFMLNRTLDKKIILVGDLNIAPCEQDVWSSYQLKDVISHTIIERELLLSLQQSFNFIDTARYFVNTKEKLYSWWSYRNLDWKKSNRGRRLDHIWTSASLEPFLKSVEIVASARDWIRPSDHAPCVLNIN